MNLHIYGGEGGCVADFHYVVELNEPPTPDEMGVLFSLTGGTESSPTPNKLPDGYVEYGPRPPTMSPWCTNALCILKSLGVSNVTSLERYKIIPESNISEMDSMTEEIWQGKRYLNCMIGLGCYEVDSIGDFNREYNLSMDSHDILEYTKYFEELGRKPTNIELYDLGQSNSEHSRHHLFGGAIIKDGHLYNSMFHLVKSTLNEKNKENSVVAFKDNSSAIKGYRIPILKPQYQVYPSKYCTVLDTYHTTFTAETHNFPTGIAPFQGATTGTGGRIRDTQCIGKGGQTIAGTVGYCVGNLPPLKSGRKSGSMFKDPLTILIEASNGASDYGNKFGEPVILGFTRSGYNEDYEWVKPIMFCGGIGQVRSSLVEKELPEYGDVIIRIGGPAYRIGVGGGSASSRSEVNEYDYSAVQRGDPEMENRLNRVIRSCCEMEKSPIRSIHDQGAGGMANVTREIVMPLGGVVYLDKVKKGDPSMTPLEIWISEHQEQNTALVRIEDLEIVKKIGVRERVEITPVGYISGTGVLDVRYLGETISKIGEVKTLRKVYEIGDVGVNSDVETVIPDDLEFREVLDLVLSDLSVGSKRFLTNKVDRSVTGLIAQQQCVGPYHTPLADCAVVAHSYFSNVGAVTAIGEQPLKGICNGDIYSMAEMTVGELVTNIMWAKIDGGLDKIKCSLNWMWPAGTVEEKSRMYETVRHITGVLRETKIAVDGGKDSVSMVADGVKSAGSVVISGYAPMTNVKVKVTPEFKEVGSRIILVNLSRGVFRVGGSVFSRVVGAVGNCPRLDRVYGLERLFEMIQYLICRGYILSGHDISDGGMITCLLEMSIASGIGMNVKLPAGYGYAELFGEELGCIIEVADCYNDIVMECLGSFKDCWTVYDLGETSYDQCIRVFSDKREFTLMDTIQRLRSVWESTSFEMEQLQCNSVCVDLERLSLERQSRPVYRIPYEQLTSKELGTVHVAIIREEGTNGDRELAAAFKIAGFTVWDVSMQDIISNDQFTFDGFSGVAFAGGFSYSDVFGAAEGWSKSILLNPRIKKLFDDFRSRKDTFSLGVCNGCQLMGKLGWVSGRFEKNTSGRFESRFSTVTIERSNSIMLKGLEGMVFGIWVAHGEGRYSFTEDQSLVSTPIKYADDQGRSTGVYPYCPNGSELGVAAVVSNDGRHLAMMPHPERSFIDWQVPWWANEITKDDRLGYSPWFRLFRNAYEWCQNNFKI